MTTSSGRPMVTPSAAPTSAARSRSPLSEANTNSPTNTGSVSARVWRNERNPALRHAPNEIPPVTTTTTARWPSVREGKRLRPIASPTSAAPPTISAQTA